MSRRETALDRARREQGQRNGTPEPPCAPSSPSPSGPQAVVVSAADLDTRPVEWLWPSYIPRGAVTVLDGDPGLGKSTLTADLAARVSRGWAMPPTGGGTGGPDPAGVLLLNAEDDPERTIRPRLEAARADLTRVHILSAVRAVDGTTAPPVLPADLDSIEAEAIRVGAALIVIDPFMAYLDGSVDSHKDADIRRVLHRVKEMAERTRAAVVIVRHLNKLGSGQALYRGGGSIGIIGAARSALLVGRHPEDRDRRVLAPVKTNLCRMPPSLAFAHEPGDGPNRLAWLGEATFDADAILTNPAHPRGEATGDAERFLTDLLANVPVPRGDVYRQSRAAGIKDRTLERAKAKLRVQSEKSSFGGGWQWRLPAAERSVVDGSDDPLDVATDAEGRHIAGPGGSGGLRVKPEESPKAATSEGPAGGSGDLRADGPTADPDSDGHADAWERPADRLPFPDAPSICDGPYREGR